MNRIAAYAIGNFDLFYAIPVTQDILMILRELLQISKGQTMVQASGLMKGKRGVIMGVANDRSIAWGIARAVAAQGGDNGMQGHGDLRSGRVA